MARHASVRKLVLRACCGLAMLLCFFDGSSGSTALDNAGEARWCITREFKQALESGWLVRLGKQLLTVYGNYLVLDYSGLEAGAAWGLGYVYQDGLPVSWIMGESLQGL